jgi:4-amino-4-deoxy-L-arabinose transferase-like glycosyltransferase
VHPIRIRYTQSEGDYSLQLGLAAWRGAFGPIGPLLPRAMSYWEFRVREKWPLAFVLLWYVAIARMLWLGLRHARWLRHLEPLADALRDRTFLSIAALGVAISAAHILYGLPSYDPLSGDELTPLATLDASLHAFRDWNLRWPTLHFNVLAMVLQPFEWAQTLFGLQLGDQVVNAAMFLVMRLVSLTMLFVTLLLTFDAARELDDRETGYFAVALLATMPVVAYFGSLANLEIPQLCWATLAFWCWLKLLRWKDLASGIVFGVVVGLSLAVKDQLYGYDVAAPVALLYVLRGVDRRFIGVGVATVVGFAVGHELPMEWPRFIAHVRSMTTVDSAPFQMFTADLHGHFGLLAATAKTFVWAAGFPAALAFVAGAIHHLFSGRARRLAGLMLPLVTYYVTFLAVILYVYDRFLIAFLPVVAIVGGGLLRAVLRATWLPRVARLAIPVVVVVAAAASAVGMDIVFQQDPRHRAADWIADNVPCGSSVGVMFDGAYVPALACYEVLRLRPSQVATIRRWPPTFVLNEAYARRFLDTVSGSLFLMRLRTGELGYQLVYRAESRPPMWAPLYWEPRFWNAREDVETILDKPLHAIEVWQLKSP